MDRVWWQIRARFGTTNCARPLLVWRRFAHIQAGAGSWQADLCALPPRRPRWLGWRRAGKLIGSNQPRPPARTSDCARSRDGPDVRKAEIVGVVINTGRVAVGLSAPDVRGTDDVVITPIPDKRAGCRSEPRLLKCAAEIILAGTWIAMAECRWWSRRDRCDISTHVFSARLLF